MRIKSYFAPSVQSAISTARKEFGDEVTLVTSHTAALESRHLGDYEVVFAVDEPTAQPEPAQIIKASAAVAPPPPPPPMPVLAEPVAETVSTSDQSSFDAVLGQAIATPFSTEEGIPAKLECVRTLLLEMGIDGAMTKALMTMIARVAGTELQVPTEAMRQPEGSEVEASSEQLSPAEEAQPAPALPDLTPAEMAFYLSVSVGS